MEQLFVIYTFESEYKKQIKNQAMTMEMMIEIFKTDVKNKQLAGKITQQISSLFPVQSINFDLSDCDKILRIEGTELNNQEVIKIVNSYGHECSELE